MTYTIKAFAELTGVTTRTLRYYDQIGLLQPQRSNDSNYRVYGQLEVEKMQHILFLRQLEVSLKKIQEVLTTADVDYLDLLKKHQQALLKKEEKLQQLLLLVTASIEEKEGRREMKDTEKFEIFKKNLVEENETKYGQEVREKYGEEAVKTSNHAMLNISQEEYQQMQASETEMLRLLNENKTLVIPSPEAQDIFNLHKEWISAAWGKYSKDAHIGLAQMYTQTPDFTDYYDEKTYNGATLILEKMIRYYA